MNPTETNNELAQENPKPARKLRFNRRLLLVAAVVAAVLAGTAFTLRSLRFVDTDDAAIDGNIMPISARINGHIAEVKVVDGQQVKAGEVLAVIDPSDYQVSLDQANAALADARAQASGSQVNVPLVMVNTHQALDSAEAGESNSQAGILAAQHNLTGASAVVEQAKANAMKTDADL